MAFRFLRSAFPAAAALALAGCFFFRPAEEVVVPLPVPGTEVRMQVWADTMSDGRFEAVVSSPHGSTRRLLWEDWGPAQRASLYWARDGRLIILGGGGHSEMFALSRDAPPQAIPFADQPGETGDKWRYLGAVDGHDLAYFPPSAQRECIPLYGAGWSPYRKAHQDQHSCSDL